MPGQTNFSKPALRSDGAAEVVFANTREPRVAHGGFKLRDMSSMLWNADVHCRAEKILPLVRTLSCMNLFQNFTHLKIHSDIVLPSVSSFLRHYFVFDFATNSVTEEVL